MSDARAVVRAARRTALHAFLRTIQRAGQPVEELKDTELLVASGLIDSLAILQIVAWLESTYAMDFSATGIDPERMATIEGILNLIEEHCGAAHD